MEQQHSELEQTKWSISIPSSKTDTDKNNSPFTLYEVKVTKEDTSWSVFRRYSQFSQLRDKLTANMNPQLIEERKQKLEAFLIHLIKLELHQIEEFAEFIELETHSHYLEVLIKQNGNPYEEKDDSEEGEREWFGSKTPTVRIRTKKSSRQQPNPFRTPSQYWVKGMKLRVTQSYTPSAPDELSLETDDIVMFLGERDSKARSKVNHRGTVGWVPDAVLEVQQQLTSIGSSPPRIGLYRSMSSGYSRCTLYRLSPLTANRPGEELYTIIDDEEPVSPETQAKVTQAKLFLKDYYKSLSTYLFQRRKREEALKEKLNKLPAPEADTLLEKHRARETAILRRRRKKLRLEDFELLDMIGRGGFGKVYLCREKFTREVVALKKIKKSVVLQRNKVESVKTEREVLKGTESPWLVKLICSFQDDHYLYFAMEYAPGGNLKGLLENVVLPEKEAKLYLAEMLLAVKSLHDLGFVHRDLKPDNFLFDKSGHIKLADFGLSKGGILKKTESQIVPMRVYLPDNTYKTIAIRSEDTVEDVMEIVAKKLLEDKQQFSSRYSLYEVSPSAERKMKPYEQPRDVMKKWAATEGFKTPGDRRFVFKEEIVLTSSGNRRKKDEKSLSFYIPRSNKKSITTDQRKLKREQALKWTKSVKAYSFVGSPHYMAPEIIMRVGYDELVDWWSLGCILYEMIVGFPPFLGETPQEVFGNILDHEDVLEFPMDDDEIKMSTVVQDFIKKLLSPASTRLGHDGGFDEIKKQPYVKDINWDSLRQQTPPFVPHLESPTDSSYFHLSPEEKQSSMSGSGSSEVLAALSPSPPSPLAVHTDSEATPSKSKFPKVTGHRKNLDETDRSVGSLDFIGFTYKPDIYSWMQFEDK